MKVIEVTPNPYIALDKDGIPQGVVGAGMPGVYVGAVLDLVATRETGKSRFYFPPNKDGSFARKVHMTADIVTAIHAGELLVTNLPDALAVGLTSKEFLTADKAMDAEKAKALAYYRSVKGPEAAIKDIPRAATPDKGDLPIEQATKQLTPTVKMTKAEA